MGIQQLQQTIILSFVEISSIRIIEISSLALTTRIFEETLPQKIVDQDK